jgi:hypothetical protein
MLPNLQNVPTPTTDCGISLSKCQITAGFYTPGERAPGMHWIGGWVDPRAGLDDMEKRKILTLQ